MFLTSYKTTPPNLVIPLNNGMSLCGNYKDFLLYLWVHNVGGICIIQVLGFKIGLKCGCVS